MNGLQPAPVYAVNLKSRVERKEHIQKEFSGRDEFALTIVEAEEHKIGARGLWNTIRKILEKIVDKDAEYIILCEDDHRFTADYSPSVLFSCISMAAERGADVLLGGVSWFSGALPVSPQMFWVDRFSGLQFTVLFRKFFQTILDAGFGEKDVADYKIAALTDDKYFTYPFISTQVEFGYSDATALNNAPGHVDQLFRNSVECARSLSGLSGIYGSSENARYVEGPDSLEDICIPTYVIHTPGSDDRLRSIGNEFSGKKEFDVTIVEACEHPVKALALLSTIRKIVGMAMSNNDNVIVICEDDHQFTEHYSKRYLLENVIEAFGRNAEILSGGVSRFDQIVPVTDTLFWINSISPVQFIVLYQNVFQKILDEPLHDVNEVKDIFTQLTSHKMVLFPFISTTKTFAEQFSTTHFRLNRICERKKTCQLS